MSFFTWIARTAAILGFLFTAQGATAQEYPARQITIIVPFAAGSLNDTFARLIAEGLQARFSQTVIVENRPGAGGQIGATEVVQAAPDGYTLLTHSSSLASAQVIRKTPDFDARTALVAIAQYGESPSAITVFKDLPVNTVPELIEYSKSNPINYGTSGVGSNSHLYIEQFKQITGLQATHVPYSGGSLALTALIGGEIQMLFNDISATRAAVEEGQIRRIAVGSSERSPIAADTPTTVEQGVDFQFSIKYGLFAPAGTPDDIVRKLNAAVNEIVSEDAGRFRVLLEDSGGKVVTGTPESFSVLVASEIEQLSAVVDAVGIERQ